MNTEVNYTLPSLIINNEIRRFNLTPNLIVIKQNVSHFNEPELSFDIESVYTLDGKYLGGLDTVEKLPFIRDIAQFEYRTPTSTICSIGFSESEQLWFGWSHRAWYSFGIGSEIKKGDCGYQSKDLNDFKENFYNFWIDNILHNRSDVETYTFEIKNRSLTLRIFFKNGKDDKFTTMIPEQFGRGEWIAQTLEDAKQMAMDYAEGVN